MNKRILIGLGLMAIIGFALFGLGVEHNSNPTEEQLSERISEFKLLEKKAHGFDHGFDVSETDEFPVTRSSRPIDLSLVKVASLYEYVTDGATIGRSKDEVLNLLKETKTDFIFRGFWRWDPCPESPETVLPLEYPLDYIKKRAQRGYTYEHLENAITEIKRNKPGIIFCGSVPAQKITRLVWNPVTGEHFGTEETWDMALDPGKWDISVSKERLQCEFAKTHFWVNPSINCKDYDYKQPSAYFPDITNEKFQELFLSWAKKQIDCGADAIWIDMLFTQVGMLGKITKDKNHPAVKESFEAASKMVDEIHKYGESKNKHIYVGEWGGSAWYPYHPQPNFDFVTRSPFSQEVQSMRWDEERWDFEIELIREKLGNIPIFAFLDWSTDTEPTAIFSQKLTPREQREFLKTADEFLQKKGVNFIYPIHGGYMGNSAKIGSFGKSSFYDSLAPEFETYETIKELAQSKSSKGRFKL